VLNRVLGRRDPDRAVAVGPSTLVHSDVTEFQFHWNRLAMTPLPVPGGEAAAGVLPPTRPGGRTAARRAVEATAARGPRDLGSGSCGRVEGEVHVRLRGSAVGGTVRGDGCRDTGPDPGALHRAGKTVPPRGGVDKTHGRICCKFLQPIQVAVVAPHPELVAEKVATSDLPAVGVPPCRL
jgi:hypothetical protein